MGAENKNFTFDPNYGFGDQSVFVDGVFSEYDNDYSGVYPPPPKPGYFLEYSQGIVPFLLENGQFMILESL